MKSVIYWWYDHMIRADEEGQKIIKQVEDSIKNKNFKKFIELRDKLNNIKDEDGNTYEFLPAYAIVYDNDNEISYLDITVEENFNKIDEEAYECG